MEISIDSNLVLLGKRIRMLRKARGFSQEYFANYININRSYYGTVEAGQSNLSVLNLIKIAAGLGVTLNDLLPPEFYLKTP
jgi:transcriptional regulator with XRE-family HTH domain